MSGFLLRLRSRWEPREWPRHREGAVEDEREWIASLSDRELADHCAALGQVDKAVKDFRKPHLVADDLLKTPKDGER